MKKYVFVLAAVIAFGSVCGLSAGAKTAFAAPVATAAGTLKIINDTDSDVQIHTGSGFVEINKTSSTSVSCEAGKVISLAEKGKKKSALFTIDEAMCGKVVKLSKYL